MVRGPLKYLKSRGSREEERPENVGPTLGARRDTLPQTSVEVGGTGVGFRYVHY